MVVDHFVTVPMALWPTSYGVLPMSPKACVWGVGLGWVRLGWEWLG